MNSVTFAHQSVPVIKSTLTTIPSSDLLHVPMQWIGVGILCLIGVAIVHGVTATRQKDPQS
ncbi:MAG: hypothetical protein E6J74_09470 [Deltaproteobacteria bacterium]|nr:MAG: hypothetical protein E6J74_09470 [Deltaproteobacteria bacterium]